MTLERHYSTAELASILSVSEDTILRAAQRGELQSCQLGRQRRFPESAVQRWLDEGRQQAPVVRLAPARHARLSTIRRRP